MTQELITQLDLKPHPEGGYFKETYRCLKTAKTDNGDRSFGTSIYYYLASKDFSAWHRLKSDELWHYYCGDGLTIHVINPEGTLSHIRMGNPLENVEKIPQALIPANHWFAAEVDCDNAFILVGCVVMPGFDYTDFEMAEAGQLIAQYPQHEGIIKRFCRDKTRC